MTVGDGLNTEKSKDCRGTTLVVLVQGQAAAS